MGASKGNRNAAKGEFPRRMVSLSGPEYDEAMKRLQCRGITNPSNEQVLRELKNLDLATIRADYRWIKECEILSIETLREIVADVPSATANEHYLKRHRQAQVVLEVREKGYDPLAPRIC